MEVKIPPTRGKTERPRAPYYSLTLQSGRYVQDRWEAKKLGR